VFCSEVYPSVVSAIFRMTKSAVWRRIGTVSSQKPGLMQGQLKARRKELAEQTAFDYYLSRLLRRPVTAR